MEYKVTFDQCKNQIRGVCSRCGGALEPLETVDNSGDPTFWPGCNTCSCFDGGVSLRTYTIAKELVERRYFRPYSYIVSDPRDDEYTRQRKIQEQIHGTCNIVAEVLAISNRIIKEEA